MPFLLRGRLENSKGRFSNRTEEAPFVTPFRRGAADSSGGFVAFYENEFSNNREKKRVETDLHFWRITSLVAACLLWLSRMETQIMFLGIKDLFRFSEQQKKENLWNGKFMGWGGETGKGNMLPFVIWFGRAKNVGEDETERGEIAFVNFISGGMRQIEIIAIRTVNCLIFFLLCSLVKFG